eukprot:GAHX01002781.1.p1 GENE.GAHX01002781.1~~GAHX01002781.1.p1  ORF type:complete len:289 (-),score=51.89 GAHX01002781.1:27-893(-)
MTRNKFINNFCYPIVLYCVVTLKLNCDPLQISTDYSKVPFSAEMVISGYDVGDKSYIVITCAYIGSKPDDLSVTTKSGNKKDSLDLELNISRPFIFFSRVDFDTEMGAHDVAACLSTMAHNKKFNGEDFKTVFEEAQHRSTETIQHTISFEVIKDLSDSSSKFVQFKNNEEIEGFSTEILKENLQITVNINPNEKGEKTSLSDLNPDDLITPIYRMKKFNLYTQEMFDEVVKTLKIEFEEQTIISQNTPRPYFLFFLLGGGIVAISVVVILIALKKNKVRRRSKPKVN